MDPGTSPQTRHRYTNTILNMTNRNKQWIMKESERDLVKLEVKSFKDLEIKVNPRVTI